MTEDLLLGRLAVGAGHLTRDELTWVLQAAEETNKPLRTILVQEGYLNNTQLGMLEAIGADPPPPQAPAASRWLYCPLCDKTSEQPVQDTVTPQHCGTCHAVLDQASDPETEEVQPILAQTESANTEVQPYDPTPAETNSAAPQPRAPDPLDPSEIKVQYMALVSTANRLIEQAKLYEAKAKLDQAIQMLTDESPARLRRAWICLEIDLPQQTAEDTTLLIERGSDLSRALILRAHARIRTQGYAAAITDLERAAARGASGPLYHVLLGTCYYKTHKLAQARTEYNSAIQMAEGQPPREEEKMLQEALQQAKCFVANGKRPTTGRFKQQGAAADPGESVPQMGSPSPGASPAQLPTKPSSAITPVPAAAQPAPVVPPPVDKHPLAPANSASTLTPVVPPPPVENPALETNSSTMPPPMAILPTENPCSAPGIAYTDQMVSPISGLANTDQPITATPGLPSAELPVAPATTTQNLARPCDCGAQLQDGWVYCPMCARPTHDCCPTCNQPLLPQWRRCPYCD